jgi:methyl-accepting chemotaxis protein
VVGVIAANVIFDRFAQMLSDVKIGDKGYAYAIDHEGNFIYHTDPLLIGTSIKELNIKELSEASDKMIQGEASRLYYSYNGEKKLNIYRPLGQLSVSVNAVESEYLKPLDSLAVRQLMIGAIFFLVGALIVSYNSYLTVRKIKKIQLGMNQVSNGDLTVYIQPNKQKVGDEVDEIGKGLNQMIESVKEMIMHIMASSESLSAASQQLSASADQNRVASEEVAGSMQEIATGAERQASVMTETSVLFEKVSDHMKASNAIAKEMADQSVEVRKVAETGENVIHQSKQMMTEIMGISEETVGVITELNNKSDEIGEINELISQIAEQTNLLALNAAIEAARAGEQGKGFAVVADEIRKLAAQSQNSAQGIQKLIIEMQEEVRKASLLIKKENESVAEGIQSVNDSETAFGTIKTSIDAIVMHIEKVVGSIFETLTSTEKVNEAIDEVVSIVHETSAGSQQIAASSQEQTAVSEEISASAKELAHMAESLLDTISVFKTE